MSIDVGSTVRIVDTGHSYPSYDTFFDECGRSDLKHRFMGMPRLGDVGTVVFTGNHEWFKHIYICAVAIGHTEGQIALVECDGLEVIAPELHTCLSDMSVSDLFGII